VNKIITLSVLILGVLFLSGCASSPVNKNNQPAQSAAANSVANETQKKEGCPSGFVLVPGNAKYGTSDFCVMKYDAKCAQSSNPEEGIQPTNGSSCSGGKGGQPEGVYKNNGPGCACRDGKLIASTPTGFPITFIPMAGNGQDNAKAYCENQGWHLMTNPEWMTIARNAEQVSENWCDGDGSHCGFAPGTAGKILANGHNDSNNEASASANSVGALIAGDDSQLCFGTTTDGSSFCGGRGSQKRTLQFSNGNVIWDFAGNVWSWVDATIERKDQPKSETKNVLDSGWIWSDFTPGSLASVIIDNGHEPALGYDAFRPSNSSWNAANGVGRIYHFSSASDSSSTQYGFIRGGNWRHGYDSGAFCVHLSPLPDKTNIDDVGFRCVAAPEPK
jgi:formylglycine-generating enzyme required for sulfatase activity